MGHHHHGRHYKAGPVVSCLILFLTLSGLACGLLLLLLPLLMIAFG